MHRVLRLAASMFFVPLPAIACVGDCETRGVVTVSDIVRGISIALGEAEPATCDAMDVTGDGQVTIDEILTALTNALQGCPLEVDQAWEGPVGDCDRPSITYQVKASQPLGQEFIPRQPLLSAVEVFVQPNNPPFADTLTATIYDGALDGPVVGATQVTTPERQGLGFWQRLSFTDPLLVRPGATYVLGLEATNATYMWLSDRGSAPCVPAAYDAGQSIIFGKFREVDLYFRTIAIGD